MQRIRANITAMRVMASKVHDSAEMDPFGFLPCDHGSVVVHILDADTMGEDLVECPVCGYVITLADLFRPLAAGLTAQLRG
jgi:hypothetical protein